MMAGRTRTPAGLALLAALVVSAGGAAASEVAFFTLATREAFLGGELDGVSSDSLGVLRLAQRVARVGEVDEPFVYSASRHPDGWVLGTGNAGRLLLLRADGSVDTLLEADEPTIFATAVDADGVVWAGASPGGRVYKIDSGGERLFYDAGEVYVWAIEPDGSGGLWVATGTDGHVHRVGPDGRGQVVLEVDDVHARSLEALPGGDLLVGTAEEGLILRLDPDGSARTLYDSDMSEIVALASGSGGLCYAAAIRSEAGFVATGAQQTEAQQGGAAVTVIEGAAAAEPGAAANGVRSRVLRFPCDGGVMETVWTFQEETVYDLLWEQGRLWIATGQEGKVFSLHDGEVVLEKDLEERQVVALLADADGPAIATTNAAALYRVLADREREGSYTSPVLDAGQIAELGTLSWRGEAAAPGDVRFAVRSGMSGTPDRTWSEWSAASSGREVPLGDVVAGRFVQFRLDMSADSGSPAVAEVVISYRQKNLAPRVAALSVLPAGQVLVPANFNPASQVYEPISPNREGIFTSLTPEVEDDSSRLKPLWKRGYRTLQWEAEDPNGDPLHYRLEFRPDAEPDGWFPIVEDHAETYFSFDATVLPDGVYRFRVTASDTAGNGDRESLESSRTSAPVAIDHTPPALGEVERQGTTTRVVVSDALNALRQAEYSLEGREWLPAVPTDGLLDGRTETFELDLDPATRLVLFRAMDSFFNLATFDLTGTP
jgi:hypothetical protein